MIYNYIPGTTEILSLQSIGQNTGVNTVVKADGSFTNIFSDLTLYTDSGGVTQVPFSAYAQTSQDALVTGLEVGKTNKTAYKTYIVTDPTYQNIDLWATFTNFGVYTDMGAVVDLVTAYTGSTKVLWTGPLSVVGVPTSLNVGEKFSDWDEIKIVANLTSDAGTGVRVFQDADSSDSIKFSADIEFYSNTGKLVFEALSDTTFQLKSKTVASGNIINLIGKKL